MGDDERPSYQLHVEKKQFTADFTSRTLAEGGKHKSSRTGYYKVF